MAGLWRSAANAALVVRKDGNESTAPQTRITLPPKPKGDAQPGTGKARVVVRQFIVRPPRGSPSRGTSPKCPGGGPSIARRCVSGRLIPGGRCGGGCSARHYCFYVFRGQAYVRRKAKCSLLLPQLPLRAFEVAARQASFTRTAAELFVTQSAVRLSC